MRLVNLQGRAHLVIGAEGAERAVSVDLITDGVVAGRYPEVFGQLELIERALLADEGAALAAERAVPLDHAAIGCATPSPRQVFAIGMNYAKHVAEFGRNPDAIPAIFTKFPSCLAGPFDEVPLAGEFMDWEVELVVVIGRRASHVAAADAWSYAGGLTVGQDITDRPLQNAASGQFSLGKSRRGCGPVGPWVVTLDEFDDPTSLQLSSSLDGEVMQDGITSDMIHDIPRLIELITGVTDLLPGDIIFTGTPDGVGLARTPPRSLQPGEVLESTIEGIGTMRNRMAAR